MIRKLNIAFLFASLTFLCSAEIIAQNKKGVPGKVNIEITSHLGDNQVFSENDRISFFISLDQHSYIYAFYQDAKLNIFQLIPGKALENHFFKKGDYMPFPADDSLFQFQVSAPFGKEHILIFASDNENINFKSKNTKLNIKQLNLNAKQIQQHIQKSSLKQYGKAQLVFYTQKNKSTQ